MRILLITTFILSTLVVVGQESKKINCQLGFGTTASLPYKKRIIFRTFSAETIKMWHSSAYGYYIEFIAYYNFNNRISLSSGLNFCETRLDYKDTYTKLSQYKHNGIIKSTYLNIPLLFRYRVLNKFPLSIGIGSYLGKYIEALSSTDPSLTKFKPIDLGIVTN